MLKLSRIIFNLKENKPFICILVFLFYILGLIAFYSKESFIIATVLTCLIVSILIYLYFKPHINKILKTGFIVFLYLMFISGFILAKINNTEFDDFSNIGYLKEMEITGRITSIPKATKNNLKMTVNVETAKIKDKIYEIKNSNVLFTIKKDKISQKLKYGDKIRFTGKINTPQKADNPSQFNYKKFLQRKGILKTVYSDSNNIKEIIKPELSAIKNEKKKLNYLAIISMRKMNDIRDEVIKTHGKYIKSPKLEVLGGIVFGDDAINPTDEVRESFINSGLLHLLAASGLNVALILSMWMCLLYFFNIHYRIKIISGIFVVFLYTIMTGFPPSIVRASVMLVLMLIGKLIYREANGISLIFMAGLIILLFRPDYILNIGFQLSFLVTLGLIIGVTSLSVYTKSSDVKFIKKLRNYPKIVKSFLMTFSPTSILCCFLIPLIAQLWAGPLQAYYFNTFSVYSILANISVVPFIGIVSFLGFISTAFCFVNSISKTVLPIIDCITGTIIQIILNISDFFSNLPNSIIKVPSPSCETIFIYYIFIILFFISIKYFFKKKFLNICTVLCAIILFASGINYNNDATDIIFFSVGNADNCLIKTKNNKYIMIDTGKYIYSGLTTAKTITLEYLYDKNIKEIDTLIVTHYDSDHSGGLIDILNNVKVKNLILPKLECTTKNSCEIKKYIEDNKIQYKQAQTRKRIEFAKDTTLINYVPKEYDKNSRNDSSTVTLLTIDGYKFLFMADAGIKSYHSIEQYLPENIYVLKSSHHGANNTVDDKMLKKIKPKYSVISVGKNTYNHPSPYTISKLAQYGKVLSTYDMGAIKFEIKNGAKVYHYSENKGKFIKID